jgi:ribosomal-protein-alanine N-acetyltransferase
MYKTYETERLLLKPLNKEAAHLVLSFYEENKDSFEPWEPARGHNFYTLAYHKASLTAEYNQMAEGKLIRYWVFLKDNPDEIIGSVCFQNLLKEPYHSCCLGYKFSPKYQHQGYAQESILQCLSIIFNENHIHRVEAYIMPNNEPSLRLIERLSFGQEGVAASFARINSSWEDHKRYVLINPEDISL